MVEQMAGYLGNKYSVKKSLLSEIASTFSMQM